MAGRRAVLFCAWLAWSKFRVEVRLRDKTLASVVIELDRALQPVGAVPSYALTDNEKTDLVPRPITTCVSSIRTGRLRRLRGRRFMADVKTRSHRATREAPVVLLAQEHELMHRSPHAPHALCFGQTRKVAKRPCRSARRSPRSRTELIGERVWVRAPRANWSSCTSIPTRGRRKSPATC